MELVRTGAREVKFYLDIAFLSQYGLDIETFENGKAFTAIIVDDLVNFANEKYGLNFDESDTPKAVYVVADHVVMVFEKRNLIYFESGKRIMGIEEKRKLLEEIRNDDKMTYIKENFIMCD